MSRERRKKENKGKKREKNKPSINRHKKQAYSRCFDRNWQTAFFYNLDEM